MFNVSKRKQLVSELQRPVHLKGLRDLATELMKDSRHQSVDDFIAALEAEGIVQKHTLAVSNGRNIPVYCSRPLSEIDAYDLVQAIFPDGYFCHLTAICHHALTNQAPNSVYWCHEKLVPRKHPKAVRLSDARIRSAFIKPKRHTSLGIRHNAHDIWIIAGTRGSDHGVEAIRSRHAPCPLGSRITCLERALIDAVVSPHYNGGIISLCEYFRAAKGRLKIRKLLEIYRKLDFIYPYAQAIGFFMDHAGMKNHAEEVRQVYPPQQRFFVDHGAKSAWVYDKRWMIAYPKGFVDDN